MKMGRDVFGNGRRIDETLERFIFEKTVLNTYRGARSAQVRFAVGKVYDEKEGCENKFLQDFIGLF